MQTNHKTRNDKHQAKFVRHKAQHIKRITQHQTSHLSHKVKHFQSTTQLHTPKICANTHKSSAAHTHNLPHKHHFTSQPHQNPLPSLTPLRCQDTRLFTSKPHQNHTPPSRTNLSTPIHHTPNPLKPTTQKLITNTLKPHLKHPKTMHIPTSKRKLIHITKFPSQHKTLSKITYTHTIHNTQQHCSICRNSY